MSPFAIAIFVHYCITRVQNSSRPAIVVRIPYTYAFCAQLALCASYSLAI